jgi:hypothetical protein
MMGKKSKSFASADVRGSNKEGRHDQGAGWVQMSGGVETI